jgi:hypothetical protein
VPHEDLHRSIMNGGSKQYRRKRKYQGADWTPENHNALAGNGIWCPACRTRHGYKTKQLVLNYEKRSGVWHLLWICTKTGDVIKDEGMVNKQ